MSRFSELVASQGAAAHWSLDESSGTFFDSIGTVHLDMRTDVTSEPAAVNNGGIFNGHSSNARTSAVDDTIKFDSTVGFSYSFLVNPQHYSTNNGVISKRSGTTGGRTFAAFFFANGQTTGLTFDIGSNQVRWSTNIYPPAGQWTLVSYTWSPDNISRCYINGVFVAQQVHSTVPANTADSSNIMVGGLQANSTGLQSNGMTGRIDDIALFPGKVLTDADIAAQYATIFPITRVFSSATWADADKRVL